MNLVYTAYSSTMELKDFLTTAILINVLCAWHIVTTENVEEQSNDEDPVSVDEKTIAYAKGSVCGYCDYCKFCKLCNDDCPCEKSPSQPNCHMCKYCKFCYVCKVCSSICQPGGILDTITSKLVNSLPGVEAPDSKEVEKDINSVKKWIDSAKDEL